MDCKFINQNDIHEKYLLDRLNESEKEEYLSHLNSCDSCKSKLDSEKELIGSVRHFGKNEMKSEIAKQVADIKSKERDFSWDMILKVAAIFFFLVITPGLVYYYQSVEPPKISELYDFDEVVNQQKEIDEIEDEEDIEISSAANEKRKREVEEKSADLLKSGGGVNSGLSSRPVLGQPVEDPDVLASISEVDEKKFEEFIKDFKNRKTLKPTSSVQSKSLSKPAKKSAPRVEEPTEIDTEDDSDFEAEQPLPPTPESTIPELEKFQKPVFSSVVGQEINRAKVLSSKKVGTTSRSMYNQTKTEQMSTDKISSAESKSKQFSTDNLSKDKIVKLDYKINDQTIIVNLIPLYDNSDFYLQELLPDSFSVIIKKNISLELEMDWFINSAIEKVKPDDILLKLSENNLIFINIQNTKLYQIDLKSDTTKAVTIQ